MDEVLDWKETVVTILKDEPSEAYTMNFHGCNKCPYKTKSKSAIKSHVQQHISKNHHFNCTKDCLEIYKCNSCGFHTPYTADFNTHLSNFHVLTEALNREIYYTCKKCDFETFSKLILLKHIQSKCHNNRIEYIKWYGCKKCCYRARIERLLKNHQISKHPTLPIIHQFIGEDISNKLKQFICTQCLYKSHDKYNLKYHIQHQHSNPEEKKWFKCGHCHYKTAKLGHLNRHVTARHTPSEEINWYKCDLCPYKSKQNSTLKRHSLQHVSPEDIEWICCDQCKFKTKDKYLLKLHVRRIHTRDFKWFECDQCPYKAKRLYHFKEHISSKHGHKDKAGGEFKCDKCPFKSAWKRALKNHTMNKHRWDDDA